MTKQELEKAIKNGENVWYPKNRTIKALDLRHAHPIFNGYQIDIMIEDENGWHTEFYGISDLYKTKAEAEHYLRHANITRTETLPFLTWDEFLEKKDIRFYTKDGDEVRLYITDDGNKIYVIEFKPYGYLGKWNATEANFYKAYDECVRLFKGGEQL